MSRTRPLLQLLIFRPVDIHSSLGYASLPRSPLIMVWQVAGPFVLFLLANIHGSMIPLQHVAAG